MIQQNRLAKILTSLANHHAPTLLQAGWQPTEDNLKQLTRQLASCELLVLAADIPLSIQSNPEEHIQQWVNTYRRFHGMLTTALFPNYMRFNARYADWEMPPIIIVDGGPAVILEVIAGFLVPYVATRRFRAAQPLHEIERVMDVIFEELACADDVPYYELQKMRALGADLIQRLLRIPVHTEPLTDFDKQVFPQQPDRPPSSPTRPPELGKPAPPTAPQELPPLDRLGTDDKRFQTRELNLDVQPSPPGAAQDPPPETPEEARTDSQESRTNGKTRRLPPRPPQSGNDRKRPVPPIPPPPRRK